MRPCNVNMLKCKEYELKRETTVDGVLYYTENQ